MVKLNYRELGTYTDQTPTIIMLHGLFGSSSNWQTIARGLEERFHLLVPDLRNHGKSPHSDQVGYPEMVSDVLELIDDHGLEQVILIGHSMGGKVAMHLALGRSDLVERLVVVDISPVQYSHSFDLIINALHAVDLTSINNRTDADQMLSLHLQEPGLRQFLLQNLSRSADGWGWRINLAGLEAGTDQLLDFVSPEAGIVYSGQTLFLHGALSDYVLPEYQPSIKALFPAAQYESVPNAGHWVYAEQPKGFMAALEPFLP